MKTHIESEIEKKLSEELASVSVQLTKARRSRDRCLVAMLTCLVIVFVFTFKAMRTSSTIDTQYEELEQKYQQQSLLLEEQIGLNNQLNLKLTEAADTMKAAEQVLNDVEKLLNECERNPMLTTPPIIIEQSI